jgi:hypothetical protein
MQAFIKLITVIVLTSMSLLSCSQNESVLATCQSNEILLEESFFSPDATASPEISPLPGGTKHSVGKTIYLGHGIFTQQVFPFSTIRRAESQFRDDLRDPVFGRQTNWSTPQSITTLGIKADDYRIACGSQHDIPMCRAILQHDHYYIFVNAHTYDDEITSTKFMAAIREIDERVQNCTLRNE